jgi:predicted KAP-like P-loop ATPase
MNFVIPDHPTWTIVALALAAPVLTFLAAYFKLQKDGITSSTIEEIKDRARFRQATLSRIDELEDREKELLAEVNKLREEITELRVELADAKHALNNALDRLGRR